MNDIQLPRHVIGRLEHRWANGCSRTRRHGAARAAVRSGYAMCSPTVRATSLSPSDVLAVLRMRLGSNRTARLRKRWMTHTI
jgi:hypothetical protein